MTEEGKPDRQKEVESILSDLDAILSDLTETKIDSSAPKPDAPVPKPVLSAPPIPPAAAPFVPPAAAPAGASPAPAAAKPPAEAVPPEVNAVLGAMKIELAPRSGIFGSGPSAGVPPSAAVELERRSALSEPSSGVAPAVEKPGAQVSPLPAAAVPPTLCAPPSASAGPVPTIGKSGSPAVGGTAPILTPCPPSDAAVLPLAVPVSSVAGAAQTATAGEGAAPADIIPPGASKEQIRKVAFLYAPDMKEKCGEFMRFVDGVALKVSKKPMYLQKVCVEGISGAEDPETVLARVKTAGAVGAVGVLAGLPEAKLAHMEEVFSDEGMFLRVIRPEDVGSRSVAVDLIVDLMLLSSG